MNIKLQKILDIIQQSEKLDAEQKEILLKAVKDADKELEITAFKLERTEKVKKTTAILLEETIEELEQKRKAVEAQNRELEIEASLERVRTVAMSMQKSDDLLSICEVSYKEFAKLGFNSIRNVIIHVPDDKKTFFMDYDYSDSMGGEITRIGYGSHPIVDEYMEKINSAKDAYFEVLIKEDQLKGWREFRKKTGQYDDPRLDDAKALYYYLFSIGIGDIGISTFKSIDESQKNILKRFRNVFDLAYRRYSDIKQAEAQAREAQIEASLEIVRSLALGMHKSEEVGNVTDRLFEELNKIISKVIGCTIVVIDEDKDRWETWRARTKIAVKPFEVVPYKRSIESMKKNIPDWFPEFYAGLGSKNSRLIEDMSGEKRIQLLNAMAEQYGYSDKERARLLKITPEKFTAHFLFFKLGYLALITEEKLPEENLKVTRRFVEVFDFAYTRFLDIKRAEAQAREAEIQLALERVRARTMAMHKSDELAETAAILFQQMTELGVTPERLNICLIKEEDNVLEVWATDQEGIKISHHFNASLDEPTTGRRVYDAWKEKKKSIVIDLTGKELNDWIRYVREVMGMTIRAELVREHRIHSVAFFSQGMILTTTPEPLPKESIKLLERFADVFNLTYRRFLDLQKAEEQAKEAQIEASLERVRAKTMAMQHSNELSETASIFFKQLSSLGIESNRLYIGIFDNDSGIMEAWATSEDGSTVSSEFFLDSKKNISVKKMYEGWIEQKKSISIDMQGKELSDYIQYISREVHVPVTTGYSQSRRVQDIAYFSKGLIGMASPEPQPEENIKLLERFAKVFDQTYTRFLDLQKAEAQARQAIKQASLDRVRGEIASMRTAEDLNRITPIIWRELKALEVPFIRCGVFIIDEDNVVTHVYLTTPEGKSLGVLNLSFDANELTINTVSYWKRKQVYKEHWDKQGFINWTKSMMELGQVQNAETYQGSSTPPESLYLHFVPFTQGMLYVGDVSPLTEEKLDLVKTLAEAFAIAYARYEDFKNLKDAKNKIEITLNELRAAQAQLVHAEKMASLGELTAGIAHEIKNPLNFVNNFSEISGELLDELKEEIEKNDKEEIPTLLENLKQNLEKINLHGKRADSIVKGMLLHSRGTSGEKTPIDINDLLDQYVNLAYHGMRAQNKEFNITIEKDYDKTLGKISVVPQDISRVFLNVINNACYAAYDKKKMSGNDFSPLLKVSTKKLNDKIEIRISDNGEGIPDSIRKQIFNPFFTTKPTGEGTGLGLSLSYDIVAKVHGGDIKVESEAGKGAEFIIQLPLT